MNNRCKEQRLSFQNKYLALLISMLLSFSVNAQIIYTPMGAAGYKMKYLESDSGFALPFIDTSIGRGINRPGPLVVNSSDSLPYYYNGKIWKPVYIDSNGVISLIDKKVDSVTVNGNNLFYWIAGIGYGAQLNKLDSIHVSSDSVFTCIGGTCTFQYETTAGSGTVTSIAAGFGLSGGTITTNGTIAVDTSVFHTSAYNDVTYAPTIHYHAASDITSGVLPVARGGTGLGGFGSAGQLLGVAPSGSALQYYTPSVGISKLGTPAYLLTKINDSTYNVDTAALFNVALRKSFADSVAYRTVTFPDSTGYWVLNINGDTILTHYFVGGGASGSGVKSVTGDIVDNTDPANPVVNGHTLQQAFDAAPTASPQVDFGSNSVLFKGNSDMVFGSYSSDYSIFGILSLSNNQASLQSQASTNSSSTQANSSSSDNTLNSVESVASFVIGSDTYSHYLNVTGEYVGISSKINTTRGSTIFFIDNAPILNSSPSYVWASDNDTLKKVAFHIDSTVTLSSGTITVSDTRVKTGAKIFLSVNTPSGTQGFLSAKTSDIVDGTSFIINSTSATETSTVNYEIINP